MKNFITSKTKFYTLFIHIFSLLLLPSCATDQWYQAENECTVVGYQYYPPNYQRLLVTKTQWVNVPDGYDCHRTKNSEHCSTRTKREPQDYQSMEDVDINTKARNSYIRHCIEEVCKQRYGNVDCEIQKISK